MVKNKKSLYQTHRKLINEEWDYEKNDELGLDPKKLTYGSQKKAWWKCKEGHKWFADIRNRAVKKSGCPKCRGYNKTTEEIIEQAVKIHGDRYDYSKVKYKNAKSKITIICKEHGEFKQTSNSHIGGQGCPKCSGRNKTTEDFIKKAKEIHGNKYNYSKAKYVNAKSKIIIICSKHGIFGQTSYSHLQGSGCPKCAGKNKTTQDFIKEFRKIHKNKYDYSKVEYIDSDAKTVIICHEHGEFEQTCPNHLRGQGCPKCIGRYKTTQDIVKEFRKIHKNKYDYSKVKYITSNKKVIIICPEHGEFEQTSYNHLNSHGCSKCLGRHKIAEDIIKEFKKVHKNKYNYPKMEYINTHVKIKIICPEHGEFKQTSKCHLNGQGCPKCKGKNKTTKEFIKESNKTHNNKYDYSKTKYINAKDEVVIICPEHGEFKQSPNKHLIGRGCYGCRGGGKIDDRRFYKKS